MERVLASIEKIQEIISIPEIKKVINNVELIEPIKNIELAKVAYFNIIVRKDSHFKLGDLVLFFETDSFIPEKYVCFNFLPLKKHADGSGGYHIRLQKIKNIYSQGIIINPLEIPELSNIKLRESLDLTKVLGIKLYEENKEEKLKLKEARKFPSFLINHRIPLIKKDSPVFNYFSQMNILYEITEKVRGTIMTVYNHNGRCGFCSRKHDLTEDKTESIYSRIVKEFQLFEIMKQYPEYAIQGEIAGPSIAGNSLKLKRIIFLIFDIYNIKTGSYLGSAERTVMIKRMKLDHVPVVGYGTSGSYDHIVELSKQDSNINPLISMKGLVYKAINDKTRFKYVVKKI